MAGRTNTKEVAVHVRQHDAMKTMAIRLSDELHAQLVMVAQLESHSVADEIRTAIEAHIERLRSGGDLANRAQAILADIDREAASRREAIQALFPAEENQPKGRVRRTNGDAT
jgi:predicted DNA-binding protein